MGWRAVLRGWLALPVGQGQGAGGRKCCGLQLSPRERSLKVKGSGLGVRGMKEGFFSHFSHADLTSGRATWPHGTEPRFLHQHDGFIHPPNLCELPPCTKCGTEMKMIQMGGRRLPRWLSGKESSCHCRRHGLNPWSGKIPHATEQLLKTT